MSLFGDNEGEMRTSISYFNALTNEVKAMAVANLHPQEFQPQEHLEYLSPMMVNVQRGTRSGLRSDFEPN